MLAVLSPPAGSSFSLYGVEWQVLVWNCKIWYARWFAFMGALFYHADAGKLMTSTKSGQPGRYQVIGKFMVEGWLWLEEFGFATSCFPWQRFKNTLNSAKIPSHPWFLLRVRSIFEAPPRKGTRCKALVPWLIDRSHTAVSEEHSVLTGSWILLGKRR